ncbi:MAG: imidazoleglycerol-phosphate dehydratase HisB [Candidatus Anammoxibacter sp.]
MIQRKAKITRKTTETDIELYLNIDGEGESTISTGVGFLDHMLDLFAKHANFDLTIKATGDLHIDGHHTVEDIGICLGQALKESLSDKKGINRFADVSVPMQETLANIAIDLSGRAAFVYNVHFNVSTVGKFDVELIEEFLEAFTSNAGFNLHVNVPYGDNSHHIAEAIFKGLAKALGKAVMINAKTKNVPSTKGIL